MEKEYLEYVGFFSLSILGAASAYFINFSKPYTLIALLMIPLSFGFASYISRDDFRKSSLASLMTLFLVTTKPIVSAVAIILAFGNPLVSVFAGGKSFRDFFSSVALPMLIIGLLLGGAVYGEVQRSNESKQKFKSFVANTSAEQAQRTINQMDIVGEMKSAQQETIRQSSKASIGRTSQIVSQNMSSLSPSQAQTLRNSLEYARDEVPEELVQRSSEEFNQTQVPVRDSVYNLVDERLEGKLLLLIIPAVGLSFYSLNPFIGLLTGFFGVIMRTIAERSSA